MIRVKLVRQRRDPLYFPLLSVFFAIFLIVIALIIDDTLIRYCLGIISMFIGTYGARKLIQEYWRI